MAEKKELQESNRLMLKRIDRASSLGGLTVTRSSAMRDFAKFQRAVHIRNEFNRDKYHGTSTKSNRITDRISWHTSASEVLEEVNNKVAEGRTAIGEQGWLFGPPNHSVTSAWHGKQTISAMKQTFSFSFIFRESPLTFCLFSLVSPLMQCDMYFY